MDWIAQNIAMNWRGSYPTQRKGLRGMSIVIAIRLENDDVLLVADKRMPMMNSLGFCSSAREHGAKLIPAFGGIVGITGNTDLACQLISSVSSVLRTNYPSVSGNLSALIAHLLTDEYIKHIQPKLKMATVVPNRDDIYQQLVNEESFAFIYATRTNDGCRIITFDLLPGRIDGKTVFDSCQKDIDCISIHNQISVDVRGYQPHAHMLLQWINKDFEFNKTYSLIQAQRLALLMIAVTAGANPSGVNMNVDMIRLSQGGPVAVSDEDITSALDWIKKFVAQTRTAFFE